MGLAPACSVLAREVYRELFRPQFHFTPAKNWMNDPNGMVFFEGEYHLFYQYNPEGDKWGHMSWGHAVSRDLVRWEHLPVALKEENDIMIFSGSVVVDWRNSSGFGEKGKPPLVAIYTGHYNKKSLQNQQLAFSNDKGRTWTKYKGNPVLDIEDKDFRDPKVFFHEGTKRWIMTVAWPVERKVRFYSSPDLKKWTHLSDFGPAGSTTGIWECPDLFPLPVKGSKQDDKWVLIVNVGSGAAAGGSGAQYFVGRFDGSKFILDKASSKGQPEFVPTPSLIVDFDGTDYRKWQVTGDAFGTGPARGKFDGQQSIDGYRGTGLVNSFLNGDRSQGTLTSPEFPVEEDYVSFLIGGGNHPGATCLNLIAGTDVVRTATGDNSERLKWKSWDIRDLKGQRVKFQVVDRETGPWGHISLDHIILGDVPARSAIQEPIWADFGPDFYAGVSWSDIPRRDGRRIWLGWMSNWEYAGDVPTLPWRSAMSLPRTLTLQETSEGLRLAQEPIEELRDLRDRKHRLTKATIPEANEWLRKKRISGEMCEIQVLFESAELKTDFGFRLLQATNQATIIKCDTRRGVLSVDRTQSGKTTFHPKFSGSYEAPLPHSPGGTRLHLFIDTSSVEVFANDGRSVITALTFPQASTKPIELWSSNKSLVIYEMNIWELKPTVPIPFQR